MIVYTIKYSQNCARNASEIENKYIITNTISKTVLKA